MTPALDRLSPFRPCVSGLVLSAALLGLSPWTIPPVLSQRIVKKIENLCPLGYVDMLNGKCTTLGLMSYTVEVMKDRSCPSGWTDIGGGYCRKNTKE